MRFAMSSTYVLTSVSNARKTLAKSAAISRFMYSPGGAAAKRRAIGVARERHDHGGRALRFLAQPLCDDFRRVGGEASDHRRDHVVDEDVKLRTVAQARDVGDVERADQRTRQLGA